MKNRAVLGFVNNTVRPLKYGKWVCDCGGLYFYSKLVAKRVNGEIQVHAKTIVECGFEWNTFHAIDKVTNYLKSL